MQDEDRRVDFDLQLFEGESHVVAVLAVPSILLVELFGFIEKS